MRILDDEHCRALARRWANDSCPSLALFAATGALTHGLCAEIEYLIIRQRVMLESDHVSAWEAQREAQALLSFRRMVEEKRSQKSPLSA